MAAVQRGPHDRVKIEKLGRVPASRVTAGTTAPALSVQPQRTGLGLSKTAAKTSADSVVNPVVT
jgi:hypothetical protein